MPATPHLEAERDLRQSGLLSDFAHGGFATVLPSPGSPGFAPCLLELGVKPGELREPADWRR